VTFYRKNQYICNFTMLENVLQYKIDDLIRDHRESFREKMPCAMIEVKRPKAPITGRHGLKCSKWAHVCGISVFEAIYTQSD